MMGTMALNELRQQLSCTKQKVSDPITMTEKYVVQSCCINGVNGGDTTNDQIAEDQSHN